MHNNDVMGKVNGVRFFDLAIYIIILSVFGMENSHSEFTYNMNTQHNNDANNIFKTNTVSF